jgi:uncharacterized coiled-coil protein SlyX
MVSKLQSQLADQDKTVDSLNLQVSTLEDQVSSLTAQVTSLQYNLSQSISRSDVQSLTDEYNQAIMDYEALLSLSKSAYLVQAASLTQQAGEITWVWNEYLDYAGFVAVQVESNSTTTYGEVAYMLPVSEALFEYNVTLGIGGTAVFPVLPGQVEVRIGNNELLDSVNAIVTAFYYY